ncbi:histidinol dehydrogenase, chloroplastic-like isoform X1 [Musa acuminata AAA Group]|uniref:histidinol dehydrogenase, chloroplastic-like isoform X1 n=2 Tax=Musa acuminata AAA Group TaxID=214697 RepID=UPI0031D27E54
MDSTILSFPRTNRFVGTRIIDHSLGLCALNLSRYNICYLPKGLKGRIVRSAMKSYKLSELTHTEVDSLKARPRIDFSSIFSVVNPIVDDVRCRGDAAVIDYTAKFDKVVLDKVVELVSDLPVPELDPAVRKAFDVAYANIYAFHDAQRVPEKDIENMTGVRCKRIARCISAVGLYVPGGTAVLPSTALMLSVPAHIAGCKTIVLATPPSRDGSICKEVLYCAKKAGVTHILKAGGAQAVSAMAWGTPSCPKVEKIFGPGNQYVTAAKMILQNSEAMVSIDMPAGPSEVLVIADKHANPVHVAADLLSQAEHGPDSQVVLVVAGDGVDIDAIQAEVSNQCASLPRGEYASKALSHSFVVFARDMVEAISFSNLYAPEHLIINVKDAERWEGLIENAGSVFLGQWTPESVGDYASGTNHVLPTYGYARMYSGVSLNSFLKYITVQSLTEEGLKNIGPHVAKMAEVEGLEAHKRAVTLRLQEIEAALPA